MWFRKKKTMPDSTGTTAEGQVPGTTMHENDLTAAAEAAAERSVADTELANEIERLRGELEASRTEHAAIHDKYVRLHAEFDNFRKRTAKERLELLEHAAAGTLKSILPVMDDLERAIANNTEVTDPSILKQGFDLIHQKLASILASQGLKPMTAKGAPFDADLHEAIAQVPAPTPALKGHVVDVVENGYTLHDKVVRFAKVVVGQ